LSESTEPLFTNEPDCVILRGQLALDVIHGAPWLDPEYGTPGYAEFLVDFEMDDTDYLVDGDFYKGTDFWRIITRRTDGRQFGFMYCWTRLRGWDSPGNDSLEAESNPNGADFGLDEGDYVFRPVAPATIPTFSFEVA